jgi:hypothetical protein
VDDYDSTYIDKYNLVHHLQAEYDILTKPNKHGHPSIWHKGLRHKNPTNP